MSDHNQTALTQVVTVPVPGGELEGELMIPPAARGVVLFAHGSGSSRLSPRNQLVAAELRRGEVGTYLFDLLTEQESWRRSNVFDIELLGDRLIAATERIRTVSAAAALPLGYFGASTGAAAALRAAAQLGDQVSAVVSRGARPDMALGVIDRVTASTLLIVGGLDFEVLELNRLAFDRLQCQKQLAVVPGASHLFEEPGTLERVSELATGWFREYLHAGVQAGAGRLL